MHARCHCEQGIYRDHHNYTVPLQRQEAEAAPASSPPRLLAQSTRLEHGLPRREIMTSWREARPKAIPPRSGLDWAFTVAKVYCDQLE